MLDGQQEWMTATLLCLLIGIFSGRIRRTRAGLTMVPYMTTLRAKDSSSGRIERCARTASDRPIYGTAELDDAVRHMLPRGAQHRAVGVTQTACVSIQTSRPAAGDHGRRVWRAPGR